LIAGICGLAAYAFITYRMMTFYDDEMSPNGAENK